MIAGPETEVMGDSLLHTVLHHLEPHDMNLVLVRIHLGLQGDMVPFVTFYRVRVAYRPTLAVLVAHERRAVSAYFPRDTNSFQCRAGFAVVRRLRSVLSNGDCGHQQRQRE
jgi:hypothetical protein